MKDKKESKTLMFLWFFSTGVWSIALFLDFYHGTQMSTLTKSHFACALVSLCVAIIQTRAYLKKKKG